MGFLALDWGRKKVGYATADSTGLVITPRGHFVRNSVRIEDAWRLTASDLLQVQKLIEEFDSETLVLGLPMALDGNETETSRMARELAKDIESKLKLPVHLVNEALTSWNANAQTMEKSGKVRNPRAPAPSRKPQGVRGQDDAVAAAQLLQDYFFESNSKKVREPQSGSVITKLLGLIVVVGLCATGFAGWKFWGFSHTTLGEINPNLSDEILVDIPPGSSFALLERRLDASGIHIDPLVYKAWRHFMVPSGKLKFGEYIVRKDWSQLKALEQILKGHFVLHQVTIKEGDNIYDVIKAISLTTLANNPEPFEKVIRDPKLLKRMGVPAAPAGPANPTLEGFLFPETYSFQKYDTPRVVVEAMLREFEKRALPHLQKHPWGVTAEGRYRLMTLASIVEKESGVFAEQPIIAAVFWNRLNKKMKLESDPTIIYGLMPGFDGNIHHDQIHAPTPYNTYTVKELPIGPIANPGENAVKSVVDPAKNDYLFFVAKGDGSHVFSSVYKDHERYVQEYQIKRRAGMSTQSPRR